MDHLERLNIGKIIRKKRKLLNYTQEYLAYKCEISITSVSNIENGKTDVSIEKVKAVCDFLQIDISKYTQLVKQEKKSLKKLEQQYFFIETSLILSELAKAKEKLNKVKPSCDYSNYLFHYYQGKLHLKKKNYPTSEKYYTDCLRMIEKYPEFKKSNIHSACYRDLARIAFKYKNNVKLALKYINLGLDEFDSDGDKKNIFHHLLFSKAYYLDILQNKEDASKALNKLWNIKSHITSLEIELNMYELKAILLSKSEHYSEALEIALEGLFKAINNKAYERTVELLTTVGTIYTSLGDLNSAEQYYKQALELEDRKDKIKNEYLYITTYTQLGKLYTRQKKFEQAKEYLNKAISIGEKYSHDPYRFSLSLIAKGDLFFEEQNFHNAIKLYNRAYESHIENDLPLQDNEFFIKLTYCYEQTNSKQFQEHKDILYRISLKSIAGGDKMSAGFMQPDPPDD